MIYYPVPIWQHIFFSGHNNGQVGPGSGRICDSDLRIRIRKKYVWIRNNAK
jgi:hypothetical protein